MIIDVQIGDDEISINTNYNNQTYEINSLYADVPINFTLKENTIKLEKEINVIVDDQNINEKDSITLNSLSKNKDINVKLEYDGFERTYLIQTLPSDFPEIEKTGLSNYEGDYYSNFYLDESNYVYKMSNKGEILYYKKAKGDMKNFEKWSIDEKQRYSYFSEENSGKVEVS